MRACVYMCVCAHARVRVRVRVCVCVGVGVCAGVGVSVGVGVGVRERVCACVIVLRSMPVACKNSIKDPYVYTKKPHIPAKEPYSQGVYFCKRAPFPCKQLCTHLTVGRAIIFRSTI